MVYVINFDLVVDDFCYLVIVDVCEFIFFEDVMEEEDFGLNGVFMFCMEYFEDNMDDWLVE